MLKVPKQLLINDLASIIRTDRTYQINKFPLLSMFAAHRKRTILIFVNQKLSISTLTK